jgi:hypothetical protein
MSSQHQLNGNHSGIATMPRARFTLPEREPAAPTAADAVTLADFIAMVEQELRFRGVAFHYGALVDFAASVWPMAQDDMDPARWASEFVSQP